LHASALICSHSVQSLVNKCLFNLDEQKVTDYEQLRDANVQENRLKILRYGLEWDPKPVPPPAYKSRAKDTRGEDLDYEPEP
jgi:hypothetical protein